MRRIVIGLAAAAAAALPLLARQDAKPAQERETKKESRTAFIRRMYDTDRCTFGDGLRAVMSLVNQEPSEQSFNRIKGDLLEKGLLPIEFNYAEESKLTKGTLAYLLCGALKIDGGVTLRVAGLSRRYALRECVYIGLVRNGTTDEYVSGRELIDVMQRADVYRANGSLDSIRK